MAWKRCIFVFLMILLIGIAVFAILWKSKSMESPEGGTLVYKGWEEKANG